MKVTVPEEVSKIEIDKKNITLDMNGSKTTTIKAAELPERATNKGIMWSTKNEKVATVNSNGQVTAKGNGSTEIVAKTQNGVTESCKVTVITSPTGISIIKTTDTIELEKHQQIYAKVEPDGALIDNIEWTNSNQAVVSIEKPIANGTYYIKTTIDERKVFSIENNSSDKKAKVQLEDKRSEATLSQQFEIVSIGDGDYKITAKNSGKAVDVTNGNKTKGTKIQQYDWNGTNSQKWKFEYAGGGKYYIKSKESGLYLDVEGGKATNGKQLQIWTENRTNSQTFKLELIEKKTPAIANGTYYIKTAINQNKLLDVSNGSKENNAAIQLYDKNGTEAQKFEIINVGNGYYVIRSKNSGRVLDIKNGKTDAGTKVQQYSLNGTNAQIWKIESAGNGYYKFKSKSSGLYLDVTGAKAENKTQLQIWTGNKSNAQKFKLELIEKTENSKIIEVATINAKSVGTTTITAKTSNGKTATCKIIVKDSKITGGQAIAEAAVQLACSVGPQQGRYRVKTAGTAEYNNITKAYIDARKRLIKGNSLDGGDYASCDVGVATAVRYSGVDKNMAWNTIPNIWPYLRGTSSWKNVGTYYRPNSTSKLQPGDVLISSQPHGHIWIYTGNAAVKKKYPNSSADGYEAGYSNDLWQSYYPHLFNIKTDSRNRIGYTVFRHVNANKKLYNKILK